MKWIFWILLIAFLDSFVQGRSNFRWKRSAATSSTTPTPDDDDDDWEEEESSEIDDDGKIYKNPRNSPSTLCPRDEEQATLLGQKCLRKCSSDEDCKSKKKKCLCDGACGMSCIKPDRECPEPEGIQYGSVQAGGKLFGSRATYTCQHGYHVVGLQSRTCQGDGQWAGSAPACKQNIYCLSPPNIDHARHNALPEQTTFDLDSTLQYYCHTGYVTNGFPRAKCLAIDGQASWYGPDISCEPRSCGPPTEISHSWHAGECYTYGCRITYHCAENYELVGKSERFCQADGTWTPKELPTCVLVTAVQCPPPESPRHGKAIYTSCSYNSVVSYECKYGYTLVGESTRKCGADRKWSGAQPQCKEINCGHPGRLWNGWLENIEGGTGLGASIIFRCHEGMLLEGNSSTVCQIDGRWRYPLPRCLAPCVVPHVSQGRVILVSKNDTAPSSTVVVHGEELVVECDQQYEFLGSLSPVSCNNGTWTQIPKCEPARCKHLPKPPKNGMVIAPKMEHSMKARFKCKDGYELKGEPLISCSFGNWTGEVPKCEEVFCPYPGEVINGKILLVGNMGLYDYRPYVKKVVNNKQIMYDCNKGYVLAEGPPGATCIGGRWSPKQLPVCTLGQHPRLRWNRRRRRSIIMEKYKRAFMRNYKHIYDKDERRYHHSLLHEDLRDLFESETPPITEGGWSDRLRVDSSESDNQADPIKVPENPRVLSARIRRALRVHQVGRRIKRELDPGYASSYVTIKRGNTMSLSERIQTALHLHHTRTRRKRGLKGGSGSRALGAGHRGSSSSLNLRRRGKNNPSDFYEEEEETPIVIKSSAKPKTKGPCSPLSVEPYVNVEIVKQGREPNVTFSPGTVVRMACGKGYKLNLPLNKTAKCFKGKWKPMKPECSILPCTVPEIPHGEFTLPKTEQNINLTIPFDTPLNESMEVPNGVVVEFSCEEGYSVQGSVNLKCWYGDWTVTAFPECSPVPCQLPSIAHGQYMSGYRAGLTIANGSNVQFQCDANYVKSTDQPIECILGKLYPKVPSCYPPANGLEIGKSDSPHYLGGKDIIKGGDITVIGSSNAKSCGPPAKVRGSLIYRNGEPIVEDENNFQDGTEVTFDCIESIMGEKNTWKIVCEDGSWIGRSLNCESEELAAHQTSPSSNDTCRFKKEDDNIISFYNDQEIREDVVEFPAGAVLISRCADIGKYAMIGSNKRTCMGGDWDGVKPTCYGLNQENDYSMEKPPTILFRHQLGPIAQSNEGKLIVYPGTVLHMECLWIRRFGIPKWTVSHEHRKYPEGWTTDPGRDSSLEYRLSIIHATKDDSGTYTCVTPARYSHSIEVDVRAVHCPVVPQRRGLTVNNQSTKMNTHLKFSCSNGNSLIGAPEVICLPSGNWSAPFPVCESIECGEVGVVLAPHLKVLVISREVGGRAVFSCEAGFSIKGSSETVCQASGDWATPFPTCQEVQCDPPTPPENGYIQGTGPYKAGDVVQVNCNSDFMMEGQPIIACQDNSRWSKKMPKCVPACSYPGTTISGRMSSVKFFYKIGENITFTCEDDLVLKGASMLKCLKNGKWSNTIPTCVQAEVENER
ncbi:complement factor H isoform X3 [Coccinella septempunctata]|uniref:complement factor H isoform X3 n=1 Tax=Coccinella septempunctata TaxID=41139 RepID=UPI001D085917|nr:complement factor H isoform X3 [Coccinella septempunctata]